MVKVPEIFESKANRFSSEFIMENCRAPAIDWTMPIRQRFRRKSLALAIGWSH